jgi:hypothetical protein
LYSAYWLMSEDVVTDGKERGPKFGRHVYGLPLDRLSYREAPQVHGGAAGPTAARLRRALRDVHMRVPRLAGSAEVTSFYVRRTARIHPLRPLITHAEPIDGDATATVRPYLTAQEHADLTLDGSELRWADVVPAGRTP